MGKKRATISYYFIFLNYVLSSGDKENFNLLHFFFEQIFFPFLIMFQTNSLKRNETLIRKE